MTSFESPYLLQSHTAMKLKNRVKEKILKAGRGQNTKKWSFNQMLRLQQWQKPTKSKGVLKSAKKNTAVHLHLYAANLSFRSKMESKHFQTCTISYRVENTENFISVKSRPKPKYLTINRRKYIQSKENKMNEPGRLNEKNRP